MLVGNTLVEDISDFNRVSYMFDTLRARHVRENGDCEAFDDRFDQPVFQDIFEWHEDRLATARTATGNSMGYVKDEFMSVFDSDTKTRSFRPLSGLVNCGKLIPLQYAPIVIELEVCNSMTDPIMSVNDEACGIFKEAFGSLPKNTSQVWQIQNPSIK